ncbi:MAG: alpha/beta fold hydrolase [Saprospiraceae bacterium]|nr:alpha/beta fold hydrolase [Saprospiraceae bacterium]
MENTLVVNGRRVFWYVHGPAPAPHTTPLVLLHGFCEDADVWMPVLRAMRMDPVLRSTDFAQKTIICMDLPGFGMSEIPVAPGMDVYADALCAVLNELNVSRVALAGHSMGGYTALAFAAHYPERLAGLSLVHSHPFADTEEQKANRRRGIELLQNGKKEAYVSQLVPGLFPEAFRKNLPELVQNQLEQARRQSAEGISMALQGMIDRADHSALLSELTVPVQFVVGELDTLVPPSLLLPLLAKPMVSDVQWLSDCGHMGLLENPRRVAEALLHFHGLCALMAPPQKA